MQNEQLQSVFQRHWEEFLKEVEAADDTPENRAKIMEAVQAVLCLSFSHVLSPRLRSVN